MLCVRKIVVAADWELTYDIFEMLVEELRQVGYKAELAVGDNRLRNLLPEADLVIIWGNGKSLVKTVEAYPEWTEVWYYYTMNRPKSRKIQPILAGRVDVPAIVARVRAYCTPA